jgi:Protein of unknown function (DUF3489)
MPKLSDTQLVILSNAAQRDGGALLPPPKRLKVKGGTLTSALKSLIRKGLVDEVPAPPDAAIWRKSEDTRLMLTISSAGLEAIGVEPEFDATNKSNAVESKPTRRPTTKRTSGNHKKPASGPASPRTSKKDVIIGMLRKADGVTIQDLQTATGWQPHSVRAALTGLRKSGFDIIRSTAADKVSLYRIAGGPEDIQP